MIGTSCVQHTFIFMSSDYSLIDRKERERRKKKKCHTSYVGTVTVA